MILYLIGELLTRIACANTAATNEFISVSTFVIFAVETLESIVSSNSFDSSLKLVNYHSLILNILPH